MSSSAESAVRQSTTQLLDSTEQSLKNLNRSLSSEEQDAVTKIRSYISESRAALKDQNLDLAHNLALKAHQLVVGLIKQ